MSREAFKHERLPTKQEIQACEDIQFLERTIAKIADNVIKIETDLEWKDGDDEWYDRARGALVANKICAKNCRQRIGQLKNNGGRKGTDHLQPSNKAERMSAAASKIAAQTAQALAATEREKVRDRVRFAKIIEHTQYGHVFMEMARGALDNDTYSRLHKLTSEEVERRMVGALAAE